MEESEEVYVINEYKENNIDNEFTELSKYCLELGFKMVSSSPLTRSSYHADEDFKKLKEAV